MSSYNARSGGKPPPVQADRPFYVVAGTDTYLRAEALAELKSRLAKDADPASGGVVEYRGDEAELAAVLDDARTPALLAPRRLVVVRDADPFVSRHRVALERYLDAPSDCGVLLLECKQFQSNTRLYKRLAEAGGLVLCTPPRDSEVPGWAVSRAATYGCKLNPDAARALVELAGTELGRIDAELSKLATYIGDRKTIETADVEAIAGEHRLHLVFAVMDAIAQRNARTALNVWERVLAGDRAAPFRAIGGLAYGLRKLIEARRAAEGGRPGGGRGGGYGGGYGGGGGGFGRGAELSSQAQSFTLEQWERMLVRLLRIDAASKSSGLDIPTAVQRFVVACCATR